MVSINQYFEIKKYIDKNRKNFILREHFEEIKEKYIIPKQIEKMSDEKELLFLERYEDELLTKKEFERLNKKYLLPNEFRCLYGERVSFGDYISAVRFVRNEDNLVKKSDVKSEKRYEYLKKLKLKNYDTAIEYAKWYRKKRMVRIVIVGMLLIEIFTITVNASKIISFISPIFNRF